MEVLNTILDATGGTPLVRLHQVARGALCFGRRRRYQFFNRQFFAFGNQLGLVSVKRPLGSNVVEDNQQRCQPGQSKDGNPDAAFQPCHRC